MNFKTGLAIAAVIFGLGSSSIAMEHGRGGDRDHDRGQFHRASWQHDDHDRKGYEKGKKTGWNNGSVPPGQAKKWQLGRPLPRDVIYYNVPQPLVVQIGLPPPGYRYVRVASDILLIAIGTGMVVDAIQDLGR